MQNNNVKVKRILFSIVSCSFSFLALSFTLTAHAQDITTGLVGHWKFDEASGTTATDSSGNNNNGTLTNGPTWTTGKIGGALSFDGVDDYVLVGNASSINSLSTFSLSFWVKGNNLTTGPFFFAKGNTYFRVNSGADLLEFNIDLSTTDVRKYVDFDRSLNNNIWHHYVATWNGSSNAAGSHIYIDGTEGPNPQGDNGSGTHTNTSDINLGNSDGVGQLNGTMDDIRIYNRALSVDEIKRLYNLGR